MEQLPEGLAAAAAASPPGGRDLLLELLDDVWREQALPVARALGGDGELEHGISRERQAIWQHIPPRLMQELQDFAQFRRVEDEQREKISQELHVFCRAFFHEGNEAELVRPRCALLGYLQNVAAYDMLRAPVDLAAAQRLEGSVGDLELLHTKA